MTPTTSSPSLIGKPMPVCKPSLVAAGARGKLPSLLTSVIHSGRPLLQTRPGSPTPGENLLCRVRASNSDTLMAGRDQKSMQVSWLEDRSTFHIEPSSHSAVSHMTWIILGAASVMLGDSATTRLTASLIRSLCSKRLRSDTTLAITKVVMVRVAMNSCRKKRDSFGLAGTNGPMPCNVPQMAIPDIKKVEVMAPRLPNRNAPHRSGASAKYSNPEGMVFRNRSQPTKTSVSSKPPASRICIAFMDKNGCVNQSSSREATIRSPTMSPSHQCSQIVENSSHSAKPPRLKLVTPMVAATAVLRIPANRMNLSRLFVCSKAFAPLANRETNAAPKSASSVLPAAMLSAVANDPWALMFTRKAPRNIPGQSQYPHKRIAANAIPLGGQTADALG